MSRGTTRNANPARMVRCSGGCGVLVWLAGALPVAADADFVCRSCTATRAGEALPTWRCHSCTWSGAGRTEALDHERAVHEGAAVCIPIDEELDSYRALREATT